MGESIQGIGDSRQEPDFDGPPFDPRLLDPAAAARAVRAAAHARYRAFVTRPADDPCLDVMAPEHDFNACVREDVANPVLFLKQDPDANAVAPRDVRQGGLGDCHLLASLAALAMSPRGQAVLRGAVVENKNEKGVVVSWTVTLHKPERHLFGKTTFREVHITVSGPYVVGHAQPRRSDDDHEIRPLILEKAFAQYSGGHNNISHGGFPVDAMTLLTGCEAAYITLAFPNRWWGGYDADKLKADLAQGKPVVFTSKAGIGTDDVAHGLLGGHAYFATGIELRDGTFFLTLGNPWGNWQPDPIPCDELTTWFSGVNVGALP